MYLISISASCTRHLYLPGVVASCGEWAQQRWRPPSSPPPELTASSLSSLAYASKGLSFLVRKALSAASGSAWRRVGETAESAGSGSTSKSGRDRFKAEEPEASKLDLDIVNSAIASKRVSKAVRVSAAQQTWAQKKLSAPLSGPIATLVDRWSHYRLFAVFRAFLPLFVLSSAQFASYCGRLHIVFANL